MNGILVETNITKAKKISKRKRERLSKKGKGLIVGCCLSVSPGMLYKEASVR